MTDPDDPRERFRSLPEHVAPEDLVETVDAATARPLRDDGEERDVLLRQAGG